MGPAAMRTNRTQRLAVATTALFGACASINLAAYPFGNSALAHRFPGIIILAIGMGLLAAQIAGLSLILVWANGSFFRRLVACWAIGLVLFGCWWCGLKVTMHDSFYEAVALQRSRQLLAALPLASLALQLPHWALRTYLAWRLQAADTAGAQTVRRPLSIGDILMATFVVALSVTSARFAADSARAGRPEYWIGWAIAMAILAALSLFFLVPLLVLNLRPMRIGHTIAFLLFAPLCGLFVLMAIVVATTEGTVGPTFDEMPLIYIGCVACLAACSIPLWMARAAGFRLVMTRG